MDQDIAAAARSVGCSGYFMWDIFPESFASKLLTATKRYARFLKDSGFASTHSSALEAVGKAAGFPNWHAFRTVVEGLVGTLDPDKRGSRLDKGEEQIKALIPTFPFLVEVAADCTPTPAEQFGLSQIASKLATACGCSHESMLDMVGRINGSDSWEKLITRVPEESKEPLYRFLVDEAGAGRFAFSKACEALIDQQDELFQGFHFRTATEQHDFKQELARVLSARPDFLEGLLAKTEVLNEPGSRRERGKVFNDAIAQASTLIPVGFKGEISWGNLTNRFYHRLLYGAMVWHSQESHTAKALALARKQLRQNKQDNLGVRFWLPVLLVADGQFAAADKACERLVKNGYTDANVDWVCAISHFASGRLQRSAESLYLALFKYPATRHVVSADFDALQAAQSNKESRRNVSPDPETLIDQYVSAIMQVPKLELAFDRWMSLPAVAVTEKHLEQEFQRNWRQPGGSLAAWQAGVSAKAALLARIAFPT